MTSSFYRSHERGTESCHLIEWGSAWRIPKIRKIPKMPAPRVEPATLGSPVRCATTRLHLSYSPFRRGKRPHSQGRTKKSEARKTISKARPEARPGQGQGQKPG